jgi:hypothetical protein
MCGLTWESISLPKDLVAVLVRDGNSDRDSKSIFEFRILARISMEIGLINGQRNERLKLDWLSFVLMRTEAMTRRLISSDKIRGYLTDFEARTNGLSRNVCKFGVSQEFSTANDLTLRSRRASRFPTGNACREFGQT